MNKLVSAFVPVLLAFGCTGDIAATPPLPAMPPPERSPERAPVPDIPPPPGAPACEPLPDREGHLVRRLTYLELRNTVRDTLGVDITADLAGLPEDVRATFSNDARSLTVGLEHTRAFAALAASIVAKLGPFAGRYTSCREERCRGELIQKLGLRLLRAPLTPEQVASYGRLFDVAASKAEGFDAGAALVLRAMLQAPQFLYRIEKQSGGTNGWRTADGFEMASRLSYLLWASAPDATLLEVAQTNQLSSSAGITAQVTRMLQDPRARDGLLTYAEDWMKLGELDHLEVDAKAYPGFTAALRREMRQETLGLFRSSWDGRLPVSSLLTTRMTSASPAVAALYGLTGGRAGMQAYELPGTRAGLLTSPAFLAVSSHVMPTAPEPSMVNRGLFILRGVLCQDVPPPPQNVNAAPVVPRPGETQRTAAEARAANDSCKGCHTIIDSLAYALEPFDAMGRFRERDGLGNPLRSDGQLRPPITQTAATFKDARQLAELLAALPQVETCAVALNLQFALGRPLSEQDRCFADHVAAAFRASGKRSFPDLVAAIATHPSFRLTPAQP